METVAFSIKDVQLPPKQMKAIVALISKPSIREVAAEVGVGEATIFRYLREKSFKEAYRAAKRETLSQALSQIQTAASAAVSTLRMIMEDTEAPASARVSAAKTILESALKTQEIEDLTSRIEALEKLLSQGRAV